MKFKEKMKKFYYAGIFLLMSMLAVGTVLAAEGDDNSNSYSLMIWKTISAPGINGEELEAILNGEYVFEINAVVLKEGKEGEPEKPEKPQTVIFGGPEYDWVKMGDGEYYGIEEISYNSAVKITAAEITDHVENAGDWDMTATECLSAMYVPGTKAEIDISKENDSIQIIKTEAGIVEDGDEALEEIEGADVFYFKVTGPGSDGSDGSAAWSGSKVIEAALYDDSVWLTGLKPGHYTIEELKAEGFGLQVNREVKVEARDTETVHINGKSGKLTIVAPEGTDDHTHYYEIKGPNRDEIVPIKHEEEYTLENLENGDYTVTEYTYSGQSGFTVKTSTTTDLTSKKVTKTWSDFKDNTLKLITAPSAGDAIRIEVSGIVGPSQGATFKIKSKAQWEGTAERTEKSWNVNNFKSTTYTLTPRAVPGTQLSVGFAGSSSTQSSNVTKATVNYIPEQYKTTTYTSNDGADKKVTVDKRGTLEITKPAGDSNVGADQVVYTFTVSDSKGNKVGELELKAGETGKLTGLAAGKYTVSEKEGKWNAQSKPFTLKVEDAQSDTGSGGSFSVDMLHEGSIKLHKSGNVAENGERIYTFLVSGPDGYWETVTLKAGEEETYPLSAGTYTVKAVDDKSTGFDLWYSDSSTVNVLRTDQSFSTIYFTNRYTQEEGSYRVVHEYYRKDSDGHYVWEGSSNVSTVRGLSLKDNSTYGAGNVTQLPLYESKEYTYTEAAYGTVTALTDSGSDSAIGGNKEENKGTNQSEESEDPSSGEEGTFESSFASAESTPADDVTTESGAQAESESEQLEAIPAADAASSSSGEGAEESLNILSSEQRETSEMPDGESAASDSMTDDNDTVGDENISDASMPGEEIPDAGSAESGAEESRLSEEPEAQTADNPEESEASNEAASQSQETSEKEYDQQGFISKGTGESPEGQMYQYSPESDKSSVRATENGDEIIILRYVRTVQEETPTVGSYKVVHEYYKRDENGEHFEGRSRVATVEGDLPLNSEMHYTVDGIERVNRFSPDGSGRVYIYADNGYNYGLLEGDTSFDGATGGEIAGKENYRPDSSMEYVFATENGDQVIILRYVRPAAAYNVVHEYFVRKSDGEISAESMLLSEVTKSGNPSGEEGNTDTEEDSAGEGESDEDDSGVIEDDSEEMYEYLFEGRSEIEQIAAPLYSTYTEGDVGRLVRYSPEGSSEYTYTYFDYDYGERMIALDPSLDDYWADARNLATAMEPGDEIIILRYYRDENDTGGAETPEPTEEPTPTPTPTEEPTPTPTPTEEPTPTPTPTEEPSPTPEPTDEPEGTVMPADDVKTGDSTVIAPWIALAVVSLGGILTLWLCPYIRKENS